MGIDLLTCFRQQTQIFEELKEQVSDENKREEKRIRALKKNHFKTSSSNKH